MRLVIIALLVPVLASAQVLTKPPRVADEGTLVDPPRWTTNFIGTSVSCVDDAANLRTNCTITGGGGSANTVEVSLAMTNGSGVYSTTVTGQAWVTGTSAVVCTPLGTTADGLTVEQVAAAELAITIGNRVAGVGFDLVVSNPFGSHGTHRFSCMGS